MTSKTKIKVTDQKVDQSWKLTIVKVRNGYIVSGKDTGNEVRDFSYVIQENEDDPEAIASLEAMRELLYDVKEYFAVYYSKHNEKNLVVEIQESNE